MTDKKILIVLGHPNPHSFCNHLADVYYEACKESGYQCEMLKLNELHFDPNLNLGYNNLGDQVLETDLVKSQESILRSDHLVFIFPNWWSSLPALLKGWIDRVFLPGFSFKYKKGSPLPAKLLKGRTARIIITMDAPTWYYKWFNGSPGLKLMKFGTLEFCGIKPVEYTLLGEMRSASKEKLDKYIEKIKELGRNGK